MSTGSRATNRRDEPPSPKDPLMRPHRRFLLHGWTIEVEADSTVWLDAVTEILGAYLLDDDPSPSADDRTLYARLGQDGTLQVPSTLERMASFKTLVFHRDRQGSRDLWIDVHGQGWVRVQTEDGVLDARLALDPVHDGWMVAHHALYPGLLELLKARGLFSVHAGLVARDGRGVLVCGPSGSGKTTLVLALATAGWGFLADDTCFLRHEEQMVQGLAFWEDLHVTDDTIEHFPSLAFLQQKAPRRENWKRHFSIEQFEQLHPVEQCRPVALLFPRVAHAPRSALRPLTGLEAAVRLIPQSVVPARPETTERHLEIIGALCNQVRSFEVDMSDDLQEVCSRVQEELDRLEEGGLP